MKAQLGARRLALVTAGVALLALGSALGWTSGCGGEGDDTAPAANVATGVSRQGLVAETTAARAAVEALRRQCVVNDQDAASAASPIGKAGGDGGEPQRDASLLAVAAEATTLDGGATIVAATRDAGPGDTSAFASADAAAAEPAMRPAFAYEGTRIKPRWDSPDVKATVDVELPVTADGKFSIRDSARAMAVHAQLVGAAPVAAEVGDGELAYRGAHSSGGDVVHRIDTFGTEDWVIVRQRGPAPEVEYEVGLENVAGVRARYGVVEFLDSEGTPRLRMHAPFVLDADCKQLRVEVSTTGVQLSNNALVPPGASTIRIRVAWEDAEARYPVTVDPSWSATGTMVQGVEMPSYVSVPADVTAAGGGIAFRKGDVIVAGGAVRSYPNGPATSINTTQVFRFATKVWEPLPPMPDARSTHTFTLVGAAKTRAMAVGGAWTWSPGNYRLTTPIYDMTTNTWETPTAEPGITNVDLKRERIYHRTVTLNDGRVMTTGGWGPNAPNGDDVIEVFDPTANPKTLPGGGIKYIGQWSYADKRLARATYSHSAATLLDGRVFVAGGHNASGHLSGTEVFTLGTTSQTFPTAANTTIGPDMPGPMEWMAHVVAPDGAVILAGGGDATAVRNTVVVYQPATAPAVGTLKTSASSPPVPQLPLARGSAGMALLGTAGRMFFGGGWYNWTSPETTFTWDYHLWKAGTGGTSWVQTNPSLALVGHNVPIVATGWGHQVLVAGGARLISNQDMTTGLSELVDFCDQGCNDGNDCTDDSCTATGCANVWSPFGALRPDGLFCNGEETCDGRGNKVPGVPPQPPAGGDWCTRGACNEATDNFNVPNGTSCDDNNACTTASTCSSGVCTRDPAAPGSGYAVAGVACVDDDNPCNGTGVCNATGTCTSPSQALVDPGSDPCTETVCVSGLGMKVQPRVNAPPGCTTAALPSQFTLDTTVPTDMADLSEGILSSTRQSGFTAGTFSDPAKRAIVSGRVLSNAFLPLESAIVSILNHGEFGSTVTQSDGRFDLVVNGGTTYVVSIKHDAANLLEVQRNVTVGWRDWNVIDDVVMTPRSDVGSLAQFNMPTGSNYGFVAAPASSPPDNEGQRNAIVVFAGDTVASTSSGALTGPFKLAFDEYTTDNRGRSRMPGDLPPASAYTYALDLRLASYSGGGVFTYAPTEVSFSKPVVFYVRNFAGMELKKNAPAGSYDRSSGSWVPSNLSVGGSSLGRVVKIVSGCSGTSGTADLDTMGDGAIDNCAPPGCTAIPAGERQQLCAAGYGNGAELWRVPMNHFTPWDINWGKKPVAGAKKPKPDKKPIANRPKPKPTECQGSIIGCENQSLGEVIPIAGTPYHLRYQSDRQAGNLAAITIPITGAVVPNPAPSRIDVVVRVAGVLIKQSVVPSPVFSPNQSVRVVWDRLDGLKRLVTGSIKARVEIGNTYPAVTSNYLDTAEFGYSGNGDTITGNRAASEVTLWSFDTVTIDGMDARAWGLGGLSLSERHIFDRYANVLYLGDGTIRSMGDEGDSTISMLPKPTPSPRMSPLDVAVAPDGTVYVADGSGPGSGVQRVSATTTTRIAGCSGSSGPCAGPEPDGDVYNCVEATAQYESPKSLAAAPDGSLFYVASKGRVRHLYQSGTVWYVETVAGKGDATGLTGLCDGVLGRDLQVTGDESIAVGPDGSLYLGNASGFVRRLVQDRYQPLGKWHCGHAPWVSATIVGGGLTALQSPPVDQDGTFGRALNTTGIRIGAVHAATDGNVYFATRTGANKGTIYAVEPQGRIRRVAGGNDGPMPLDGDGLAATSAYLGEVSGIALYQGNLYFTDRGTHKLRVIDPLGYVHAMTAPGATVNPDQPPDVPAQRGTVNFPEGVAVGPEGSVYVADEGNDLLRVIRPPWLPGCSGATMCVPSDNGGEVFGFDAAGRHLWTKATLGGATKVAFAYSASNPGQVVSITDVTGKVTAVATTGSPPTAVTFTGPFGQTTALTISAGYTTQVRHVRTAPSGFEDWVLGYGAGGLLSSFKRPGSAPSVFQYDALGRLTSDKDPVAAEPTTLAVTYLPAGREVVLTSPEKRALRTRTEDAPAGGSQSSRTDPSGVVTTTVSDLRGATTTTELNGAVVSRAEPGDAGARFGMLAPENTIETTTIAGNLHQPALERTISTSSAATLANANDVFTTTSEVTNVDRGGKVGAGVQSTARWSTTSTLDAGAVISRTTTPTVDGGQRTVERVVDAKQRIDMIKTPYYPNTAAPLTTKFNYSDTACASPPTGNGLCGGRLSSIVVSASGETSRTTTLQYAYGTIAGSPADPGWLSAVVDPEGYRTTFGAWNGSALTASGRDGLGRITKITRTRDTFAPSFVTDLGYDGNGNVSSVTPPGKTAHTLTSNAIDLLTGYQPPQGSPTLATKDTTYVYNQERGIVAQFEPWNAISWQLLFGRDSYGRMSTRVDSVAGTTTTWSYNLGRVSQIALTGGNGGVTVAEAFAGRLPIQTTYTGSVAAALLRTYDHEMRVTKLRVRQTTPSQFDYPIATTYAADGLLSAVALRDTSDTNDLATVTYTTRDGIGQPKTVTVTRGSTTVSETATFNGFGEPMTTKVCTGGTGITCTGVGATTYYEVTGTVRDKLGRLTAMTETVAAVLPATTATNVTWGYTYDEAGRLKTVAKTGAATTTYAYDANGNPAVPASGGDISAVTVDGQDRLTALTKNGVATSYSYRNNGSLWLATSPAASWTFLYDLQGNLQTAAKNGTSLRYLVDGLNRRVGKYGTGATHTASYVYDGQLRVAAELDATTGAVTHVYAYGEKATTPELVYQPATTKTYRIVSDVRGSVRLVLDLSTSPPTVRQRIDYDAWGVATESLNLTLPVATPDPNFRRVSLGFAGGLWDRDTGLVRFGARDYEPATGRWVSKDPVRFDGGANLYAYAKGDPVNYVDWTGRSPSRGWFDGVGHIRNAVGAAQGNFPGDPLWNTPGDAFKHCFGACTATQKWGSFVSWAYGAGHELQGDFSGQPANEREMDDANNAAGRKACIEGQGNPDFNCEDACLALGASGGLINYPRPTGPALEFGAPL